MVNFRLKFKFRSFSFKLKHQEAYVEGGRSPNLEFRGGGPLPGNLEFGGGGGYITW